MTWTYIGGDKFVNERGERRWRHKLPCADGGSKHEYESWGLDVANFGLAGFRTCEVFVCVRCMREKRKRLYEPYCRVCGMLLRRITVGSGWVHVSARIGHAPSPDDKTLDLDMEED